MTAGDVSRAEVEASGCAEDLYLELQHGAPPAGVEQQAVGADAGAWVTRVLQRDLREGHT